MTNKYANLLNLEPSISVFFKNYSNDFDEFIYFSIDLSLTNFISSYN